MTVSFSVSQTLENAACSEHDISFEELAENQEEFEQILTNLGIVANEVCLCPSGQGYCDWSSKMFQQFIFDTNEWDLTSIEIYVKNSNGGFDLISESLDSVLSPSGGFAFIEMSNSLGLEQLPVGSEMEVIFRWDNAASEEECAILKNVLPE